MNKEYTHLTIKELKEDLLRMLKSRNNGEDAFSDEIFNIEQEIKERELIK